jgi:hypothetical protein
MKAVLRNLHILLPASKLSLGPLDEIVTTATNPGGGTPVGHQSVLTVSNKDAR